MNDPHVVALVYNIEHADSVDYSTLTSVEQDLEDFKVRMEDGQVRFQLKKHYSTVALTREAVDRYIKVWELDSFISRPREQFGLRFCHPEVIDWIPTPGRHVLNPHPVYFEAIMGEATLRKRSPTHTITAGKPYPEPPKEMTLDPCDKDVRTLVCRFNKYIQGRQDLITVAYLCLTVIENRGGVGNRKTRARTMGIDYEILNRVGKITGNKGGRSFGRKAEAFDNQLTVEDKNFLEESICTMIRRLSERAFESSKIRSAPLC